MVKYPDEWIEDRLLPMCRELELLKPEVSWLRIMTGYRVAELHKLIGSQPGIGTELHETGMAVDIAIPPAQYIAALDFFKDSRVFRGMKLFSGSIHLDRRPGNKATTFAT